MSLNTTPRTWVAAEVVTAANMNTEVRDALTGIQAAWTAFTPTWTSSGTAPAIGNGTLSGRYSRIGKTVHMEIHFLAGSTTTFGTGNYSLSLPVTAANAVDVNVAKGVFWFRDQGSTADYMGFGLLSTTTTLQIRGLAGTATSSLWSATTPVVPANTDWLTGSLTYEAA